MYALALKPLRAPLLLLALAACELPVKVGDLPTAGESDTAGSDTDETTGSTGETTTPDPTTGEPSVCATLSESDCAADPTCAPLVGRRYLNACMFAAEAFIACHDADLECTPAPSTVCDDEGDSFELAVTCEPPGLTACEPPNDECGQPDCTALDERTCLAQDVCKAIHGNPHLGVDTPGECVDTATTTFLGCIEDTGACPPFIPTVCPDGAPDERYDVPAGCVPPHFVMCGAEGLPAC